MLDPCLIFWILVQCFGALSSIFQDLFSILGLCLVFLGLVQQSGVVVCAVPAPPGRIAIADGEDLTGQFWMPIELPFYLPSKEESLHEFSQEIGGGTSSTRYKGRMSLLAACTAKARGGKGVGHILPLAHAGRYACMHACMHTCMHACIHVCIHACMHVCMHACLRTQRGNAFKATRTNIP